MSETPNTPVHPPDSARRTCGCICLLVVVLSLVVVTAVIIVYVYLRFAVGDLVWRTTIAELDLGHGRTAVIGRDSRVDVLVEIACKVVDANGETPFTWTHIGTAGDSSEDRTELLEFSVVRADGGELVGIIENHNPDTIVKLYDFRTNECWSDLSCYGLGEAPAYAKAWKESRLQRLHSAYRGRQFELAIWAELGVPRKGQ